jgi:hypothetical protein
MKRIALALTLGALVACGGADDVGIGGECEKSEDCKTEDLTCLTNFKGGYCGASGCMVDADCPDDSFCVTHDDTFNYCFRTCTTKAECNENRESDNEANCSSSINPVENTTGQKACVPPS